MPLRVTVNKKAVQDYKGVIYVTGRPLLLNRRCMRLPGCFHYPKRKLNYNF